MRLSPVGLAAIIAALLIFGLGGCGEPVDIQPAEPAEQEDSAGPAEPAEPAESEPPPQPAETYHTGDSIDAEGLIFTLNDWWVDAEGEGEFSEPDEGQVWVYVDCTVENRRDESELLSSLMMFELVDADGYTQDVAMFAPTKGSLDGEVGPGRRLSGQIAYEVEDGSTEGLELVVTVDVLRRGQIIFCLE